MSIKKINYGEPLLAKYLNAKARSMGVPLVGNFELTPCCNLACKMCYVRLSPAQAAERGGLLSTEKWKDYIDQSIREGMIMMLITGGEPTMRPDFCELYEYAHERGVLVAVNTNGTLLNDEMFDTFRRMPPHRINITLYGASAATYKSLCGDASAFDKVIGNAKKLRDLGVSLKFNHTITRYNVQDVDRVIELARELDIYIQHTSYIFPPARREGAEADRLTAAESARAGLRATRRIMTEDQYRAFLERSLSGDPCVECLEECVDVKQGGTMQCRAGSSNFWLAWDGSMRPCALMPWPAFDVDECGGIKQAWDKVRHAVENMRTPAKCETCTARNICMVCGAACINETGSTDRVPEYLCERAEAMIGMMREELNEIKTREAQNEAQ